MNEKVKSAFKEFLRAVLAALVAFLTTIFATGCNVHNYGESQPYANIEVNR